MPTEKKQQVELTYEQKIENLLKGENSKETALAIANQMRTGFKIHVSAQEGEILDLEDKVNVARKNVELALMNNGKPVTDRNASVQRYIEAEGELEKAEQALERQRKVQGWLAKANKLMNNETE